SLLGRGASLLGRGASPGTPASALPSGPEVKPLVMIEGAHAPASMRARARTRTPTVRAEPGACIQVRVSRRRALGRPTATSTKRDDPWRRLSTWGNVHKLILFTSSPTSGVRIQVIESAPQMAALEEDWDRLHAGATATSVFMSFSWQALW